MYKSEVVRMKGWVSLDTLHLSIRYPKSDVFESWGWPVAGVPFRRLKEGVPVGGFVVRTGASGYKVSVWQRDARAYLTDQVDEMVGSGCGMGIWLQLGPRFLLDHTVDLKGAVGDFLGELGVKGNWPARITRLDLAIDLPGVSVGDDDLELWRRGWVGRSKVSAMFLNSRSGRLETVNVGVRGSAVCLRVYDKVAQAVKEGDIEYWQDVWEGYEGPVCRVEWEVRPTDGGFTKLQDFEGLCDWRVVELMNYLVAWGRLCIPDPGETNNRRWQISPLWAHVGAVAAEWADGINWATSRMGKGFSGISEGYIRFLSGAISGGMARFGPDEISWYRLARGLEEHGQGESTIKRKAEEKAAVLSRL